jgi:hypothetical protein
MTLQEKKTALEKIELHLCTIATLPDVLKAYSAKGGEIRLMPNKLIFVAPFGIEYEWDFEYRLLDNQSDELINYLLLVFEL